MYSPTATFATIMSNPCWAQLRCLWHDDILWYPMLSNGNVPYNVSSRAQWLNVLLLVVVSVTLTRECVQELSWTLEQYIPICNGWVWTFGFGNNGIHETHISILHLRYTRISLKTFSQNTLVWCRTCLVSYQTVLVFKVLWIRLTPKKLTPNYFLLFFMGG